MCFIAADKRVPVVASSSSTFFHARSRSSVEASLVAAGRQRVFTHECGARTHTCARAHIGGGGGGSNVVKRFKCHDWRCYTPGYYPSCLMPRYFSCTQHEAIQDRMRRREREREGENVRSKNTLESMHQFAIRKAA